MSIVALKKKMDAKKNQSGNHSQFSLNGTYRNQGFIGQTSVYRNLPRTFLKNNAPKGHGGNYARIQPKIVSFGGLGTLVENNRVVKSSVLSYNGMIASKYKWLKRPAPYITVKEDPSLECSVYTDELAKNTFLTIEKNCPTTLLTYYNNPPTACSANTPPIKTFLSSNPLNRKKRNCNVIKPNYLITSLSQSEYLRNIGGICKLTLPTGTNPYINISFDNNTADAGTLKSAPIFQSPAITPTYSTDVALTNYNNSAQPVLTKSLAFNSNNPLMILAPSTAPNTPSAPSLSPSSPPSPQPRTRTRIHTRTRTRSRTRTCTHTFTRYLPGTRTRTCVHAQDLAHFRARARNRTHADTQTSNTLGAQPRQLY